MSKNDMQKNHNVRWSHHLFEQWKKIAIVLAVFVLFATGYILSQPAITMTNLTCSEEEHTHSEDCYDNDENGETVLVCEQVEHVHTDDCYEMLMFATGELSETGNDLDSADPTDSEDSINSNQAPLDFKDKITEITLQKRENENQSWQDVTDGSIKKNDELKFKIKYTLEAGFLDGNNQITYTIPNGFTNIEQAAGNVLDDENNVIGTYTIDNGVIVITLYDKYVNDNKTMPFTGTVSFQGKIDESATDNSGNGKIVFSETVDFEIKIEDKVFESEDLTVKKGLTSVDSLTGKMKYKITVTSANGTASDVTLADRLVNAILEEDSIEVSGIPDGSTVETGNGFPLILPRMSPGSTYTIEYTAKATLDRDTNADISVENTAEVTSTDSDGKTLYDSASVDTKINHKQLEKKGVLSSDGKTIAWTIIVNEMKQDIGGWKLADVFNEIPFEGEVSISPAIKGTTNISLPYIFPEGSKETYTITYTTDALRNINVGNQAINRAYLTPPGEDNPTISVESWTWIGNQNFEPLEKEAVTTNKQASDMKPDEGNIELTWKLTVDTTEGALPAGWTLRDTLEGGQWFTKVQVEAFTNAFSGLNYDLQLTELNTKTIVSAPAEDGKYESILLIFRDALAAGQHYEVTYTSTAPANTIGSKNYHNKAWINDKFEQNEHITRTVGVSPSIKKYDPENTVGSDTEHTIAKNENPQPEWYIDVTIPAGYSGGTLYILDDLPGTVLMTSLSYVGNGDETIIAEDSEKTDLITYTIDSKYNLIKISVPESFSNNDTTEDKILRFKIKVQLNDDTAWTKGENDTESVEIRNKVQLLNSGNVRIKDDDQTQTFVREREKSLLTKGAGTVTNNRIPYELHINPEERDLLAEGDYITLIDEATYNQYTGGRLSLVPSTVHVYNRNPDGTRGTELQTSEYTSRYEEITDSSKPSNLAYTRRLTFELPDEKALIVTYEYLVNGTDGYEPTFNNSATLEGVSGKDTSDNIAIKMKISESSATGGIDGIRIYKVDSDNVNITLSGAEFKLLKYNKDTGSFEVVSEEITTGNEGNVVISNLSYNTAYQLIETKAPRGYELDETIKPYEFYLPNADLTNHPESKPAEFAGVALNNGDSIYLPNTKTQIEYTLPQTGGTGTYVFYMAGGLLLFSAAFLYGKRNWKKVR